MSADVLKKDLPHAGCGCPRFVIAISLHSIFNPLIIQNKKFGF